MFTVELSPSFKEIQFIELFHYLMSHANKHNVMWEMFTAAAVKSTLGSTLGDRIIRIYIYLRSLPMTFSVISHELTAELVPCLTFIEVYCINSMQK